MVVFVAVFCFGALAGTSFHVVSTAEGDWRGLLDPPDVSRCGAAGVLAALALLFAHRRPRAFGPLAALGLAAAPFVPVLTGHFGWLLGFQGAALVLVAFPVLAILLRDSLPAPRHGWSPLLVFAIALAAFGGIASRLPGPAGAQGDEPHYLTMAESLRSDGDLDLRDEFRTRAYRPFYPGELGAHRSPASPRRNLYTVHTPGVSALVLPAYALGGQAAVRGFLVLLNAGAAAIVFCLARAVLRDETGARATFAALVLTAPMAFFANQIYPEAPATLAVAILLATSRGDGDRRLLAAAGACAGALAWIHPKYLPLALVGISLTILRRGGERIGRGLAFALCAVGWLSLLWWMNATYGLPSLRAAYGPRADEDLQLAHLARGLPGLLLDREFGLLPYAPLWALAAPGALLLWRRSPGEAMRAALFVGSVVVPGAAYSMWWGGTSLPGRFMVPAAPAVALCLAPALRRWPRLSAGLLGFGAGVVAIALASPRALHSRADGESAFVRVAAPALQVDQLLPSFVDERPRWTPTVAFRPHARRSGLELLDLWGKARITTLAGHFSPERLVIPLLDGPPWRLSPGETRGTPRLSVPAGLFEARVLGSVAPSGEGRFVRFVASRDEEDFARAFLGSDEPEPRLLLDLPEGARRLEIWATGLQAGASIDAILLRPVHLSPAGRAPRADRQD